jgi:hypothetical protein
MKLLEKDMEDLIILNPQKYLNELELKLIYRQYSIGNYRFDLLFEDRHKGKLIIEIQLGTLDRNHTYKILDYYDEYKSKNPSDFIELMIIANKIPRERRERLNSHGISFIEIPESIFLEDPAWLDKQNQTKNEIKQQNQIKNVEMNNKTITKNDSSLTSKMLSLFDENSNKVFTCKEIIDKVLETYPGTNSTSVIPSDYCYNITNKGIPFKTHLFEYLGAGDYRCLGKNHPYSGDIHWKGEKVGEWENGVYKLWKAPIK